MPDRYTPHKPDALDSAKPRQEAIMESPQGTMPIEPGITAKEEREISRAMSRSGYRSLLSLDAPAPLPPRAARGIIAIGWSPRGTYTGDPRRLWDGPANFRKNAWIDSAPYWAGEQGR